MCTESTLTEQMNWKNKMYLLPYEINRLSTQSICQFSMSTKKLAKNTCGSHVEYVFDQQIIVPSLFY
jgi:hypothetical protein